MQVDSDQHLSVEMVRMLLRKHLGTDLDTGDIPRSFPPRRLAVPAGEEQLRTERRAGEVYGRLGRAMEEELASDRRFFMKYPNRSQRVRAAFPVEEIFFREQSDILEGPGSISAGALVILGRLSTDARPQIPRNPSQDELRALWRKVESNMGARGSKGPDEIR